MSGFKKFQKLIRSLGGVWRGNNVYFSQMRDWYSALYRPDYPENSSKDMVVEILHTQSAYNERKVRVTIWRNGAACTEYFDSIGGTGLIKN